MNIFLLFLTTLLMIGYYVMYSPSQNLPHLENDNVIEAADLQALAERVVRKHNDYLINGGDDHEEKDGIHSCYFCLTNEYHYDSNCTNTEYHVWLTNSQDYVVPEEKYSTMVEIIGKAYSFAQNFGVYIYENPNYLLYTKGFKHEPIWAGIVSAATSKGCTLNNKSGQLVYFTTKKHTDNPIPPQPDPDNPQPEPEIDCNKTCQKLEFLGGIQNNNTDGYHCPKLPSTECICYTEEISTCSNASLNCLSEYGYLFCDCSTYCKNRGYTDGVPMPDGSCVCELDDQEPAQPENPIIPNDPPSEEDPCSNGYTHIGYRAPQDQEISQTLTNQEICGPCMTLKKVYTEGRCEKYCVPNPNKADSRTCLVNTTLNSCPDDKRSIYFGFGEFCGTDISTSTTCFVPDVINETDQNVIDKIKEFAASDSNIQHDAKFHCMECPNGVKYEESVYPYTVVCK